MNKELAEKMEAVIRENFDMKAAIREMCNHAAITVNIYNPYASVRKDDLERLANFLEGMKS